MLTNLKDIYFKITLSVVFAHAGFGLSLKMLPAVGYTHHRSTVFKLSVLNRSSCKTRGCTRDFSADSRVYLNIESTKRQLGHPVSYTTRIFLGLLSSESRNKTRLCIGTLYARLLLLGLYL